MAEPAGDGVGETDHPATAPATRRRRGPVVAAVAVIAVMAIATLTWAVIARRGEHRSPTGTAALPATSGPGAPIAAGLTVPDGTVLLGGVFPIPAGFGWSGAGTDQWSALLEIDPSADPVAVWNAVATQARDLGFALGSAAESCRLAEHDPRYRWPPGQPTRARERGLTEAGPWTPTYLSCWSSAVRHAAGGVDGPVLGASANRGPHESHLTITWASAPDPAAGGEALTHHLEPTGPVDPSVAAAALPRPILRHSAPGGALGATNNCFDAGYRTFTVPDGARELGTGYLLGYDDVAIVAVDDAKAALDDLARQFQAEAAHRSVDHPVFETWATFRGEVLTLRYGAEAGGACWIQSNPEGTALRIDAHSD